MNAPWAGRRPQRGTGLHANDGRHDVDLLEHARDFTTECYLRDLGGAATARAAATRAELTMARGRATASTPAGADAADAPAPRDETTERTAVDTLRLEAAP